MASTARPDAATAGPTKPPRSKTEPYYSISPLWSDVKPIPQIDLDSPSTQIPGVPPNTGPALATILYTPRYTEAMSYLRAVMAANEYSQRALALTEDVIGMNAAHYTVWLYRFRVLKELWGIRTDKNTVGESVTTKDSDGDGSKVIEGVRAELKWLEVASEKHLKNYQIWQHRHSLVSLLPNNPPPPSFLPNELKFLQHILGFDAKNYHVWTYRQWLCTKFPDPLLTTATELANTADMLAVDVRNNSAWSHRYFVAFGHKELAEIAAGGEGGRGGLRGKDFAVAVADLDVVDRELDFVRERIRWAPQNISAWNYLRGVMRHAGLRPGEMKDFASEFVGPGWDFETEDDVANTDVRGVRSSYAIELLIDCFDEEGTEEGKERVRAGLDALARKWDPIRARYWAYRLKRYEAKWKEAEET